jgi:MYXO-CTERM domain-containing protein
LAEGDMKFRNVVAGAVLVQGIALLGLSAAHADVILTYTGNDFTFFTAPYSATDKVTASITLANPLGDNLNLTPVTPLAFSLSDGVQTITNAPTTTSSIFEFTTDATGTISGWEVTAEINVQQNEVMTANNPISVIDEGLMFPNLIAVVHDAGSWTTSVSPVPAPPLSNLAALGVLGLAFLWRRRRQIRDLAQ